MIATTSTNRQIHVENAVLGLVNIMAERGNPATEGLWPASIETMKRLAPELASVKRLALLEELEDRYAEAQKDIRAGVEPKDSLGGLAHAIVALTL